MKLAVYNINGQETGRTVELDEAVFGIEPNEHAVYLDVKQFLANQRQGTHKSKERSEVSGSTRKLHKQKGGGGARHGDINSPLMVGGGRVFGPRPRDYHFKLNRKLKSLARRSALSDKAANNLIKVVETFNFEAPKTKEFLAVEKALDLAGSKLLMVMEQIPENVYLSARNIPNTRLMRARDINTYSVMNSNMLVLTEESVETLNNMK